MISVIITAYNRNMYLGEALESLYNQTLDQNLFEIFVITNIRDKELERKFKINTNFIYMEDGPVSEYIIEGIKMAKGNIISFLDDDDLFMPNKLEAVLRKFLDDPDLIYLHNNFLYLLNSQNGNEKNRKRMKKDIIIYTDNIKNSSLKNMYKVINKSYAVNLSSVSVRREVLLSNIEKLTRMKGATDYYILYLCLSIDSSKLFFLKQTLTAYRISNSETHIDLGGVIDIIKFRRLCEYQLYSFESLLSFNRENSYYIFILSSINQWRLLLSIIEPSYETKKMLLEIKNYIETTRQLRYLKKYIIIFFAITKMLFPKKTPQWFLLMRSMFYM
jgi:glycosyltransferase involved in cell wall biosynthesis